MTHHTLLNKDYCRVYWGSHGCKLTRGHTGGHVCVCCECTKHPEQDSDGAWCAGAPPYYGIIDMETTFYGEDVIKATVEKVPLTPPGME